MHLNSPHTYGSYDLLASAPPGGGPKGLYEGSLAQALREGARCDVVALDHQSYGESQGVREGVRSYFDALADLANDLIQLIEDVRRESAGLAVFLEGVSLGGCLCTMVAARRPELVDGMVLIAPLVTMDEVKKKPMNKVLRPLVGVLAVCAPALAAGKKSPNPHAVTAAEFQNDPLTYNGKVRARVAREVLNSEEGVVDRLRKVRCPLLVLHSVADTLTSIDGSRMLIREAATPAADKVLDELQSGWHANPIIYQHDTSPVHKARIAAWLKDRAAKHSA